jgi:CRP-like cAMP-binding protein
MRNQSEHFRREFNYLTQFMEKMSFSIGQYIYHQNEEVNGFYIIKKGEVEVLRKIILKPSENF